MCIYTDIFDPKNYYLNSNMIAYLKYININNIYYNIYISIHTT